MKVLHIGKYFPPYAGGMETYLRDLMAAQARQGIDTAAVVHQSDITVKSQDESYPAGDQQLPISRAAVWARLLFTPISPTFPFLLNRLIKQQQPDILHLHMPNVSVFWALFIPRARQVSWVVHWHADVLASEHSLGLRLFCHLYRPFERAILKRCKAIIATSPPYLESSDPLKPYSEKCHVIPLGLDPTNLPRVEDISPTASDAPLRVLAIGRLTYYKGFEYLIKAAAECERVEIHFVGKGDQETALKALAGNLNLQTRITFHGHLSPEQLAQQFSACDCLCLPSIERTEAFGMVLLEAMYHSKATVISNVSGSGMGWVVDDEITGLHFEPQNSQALRERLQYLASQRSRISILGSNGRAKFEREFHIDKSSSRISAIYLEVNNTPSQSPKSIDQA
ncbi:MAG: glycosyltransferase involved in cell wall biosynthesis [Halieaceae bacterium]